MMSFFFFFNMLFITMMFSLVHPVSIGLLLVSLALATSGMMLKLKVSWFFYLIVLVFLGGVMVLIMYMCTLAANEKFKVISLGHVMGPFLLLSLPLSLMFSPMFNSFKTGMENMATGMSYESHNLTVLLFLMLYLLLAMVSVVKLVKFESGPLIQRL
uniref:NADH dehydrogenase subunit 6 n=1 Tax=Calanus simillimus TaxID=148988 RepID=UPI002028DB79|nr:NADH dehydrogenase subunit 6 [Calanus simillimus]UPP55815.1 NADH dehydrogenase subunit 6 [Calanus simillimus]